MTHVLNAFLHTVATKAERNACKGGKNMKKYLFIFCFQVKNEKNFIFKKEKKRKERKMIYYVEHK